MLRFKLQCTVWWWQLVWSDGWTPESVTKFGWCVSIRSIHEAKYSNKSVGSFISWCRPWNEKNVSSRVPSIDVLSSSYQVVDWEQKSGLEKH